MRGRTNIPPRSGGIVTGSIKEYQVAEAAGIEIGDYVEFGIQNDTSQCVIPFASTSSSSTTTNYIVHTESKNNGDVNASVYYTLSNGKKVSFYTPFSEGTSIIAVLYSIVGGELLFEEQTIAVPASGSSNKKYIVELATNRFLFIGFSTNASQNACLFLNYVPGINSWTSEALIFDNAASILLTGTGLCRLSETLFGWVTYKGFGVLRLDANAKTLTSTSFIQPFTSSYNAILVGTYNGYVVLYQDKKIYTILVTSEGTATLVSIVDVSVNYGTNFLRLDEKSFLCLTPTYTSSLSELRITMSASIIEINDLGQAVAHSAISRAYTVARTIYNSTTNVSFGFSYIDGMLVGEVMEVYTRSSYGSTEVSTTFLALFTLPLATLEGTQVILGDLSIVRVLNAYSNLLSAVNDVAWYEPIEMTEGVYLFGGTEGYINKLRMYIAKPTANGFSNLFSADLIRKYMTKILGIAKTGGKNGEVIEVYVPN